MTTPFKVRIGAIAWCGFTYFSVLRLNDANWAYALLLLAVLVLVPMAWCLARDDKDSGVALILFRTAMTVQLPAALLLIGAFLLPAGPTAILCTLPWLVALGCMAVTGILRVARRRLVPLADLVRDAGLIFASVGGVWLLADRAGMQPMGFARPIVILTAVHFHYTGLILPIVTGLALARRPASRIGPPAAWGVIFGVPLVALGITASQFGWGYGIELCSTVLLVLAGWGVAWLHFQLAWQDQTARTVARVLWGVAGVALALGMLLAALYGLRSLGLHSPFLDIPWMRALHGTINALGFSLTALLAWCRVGRCCPHCAR